MDGFDPSQTHMTERRPQVLFIVRPIGY